jgi:endonuclease YncB( thermonuclease family)
VPPSPLSEFDACGKLFAACCGATVHAVRPSRRPRQASTSRFGALSVLVVLSIVFITTVLVAYAPTPPGRSTRPLAAKSQEAEPAGAPNFFDRRSGGTTIEHQVAVNFSICRKQRHTCVVDGDTFWLEGVKIRVADIDAPEIGSPKCPRERELGVRATVRLMELLNLGAFELQATNGREYDRYGRLLRVVVRNGQPLGDQLVREGLAHQWEGRKLSWCGPLGAHLPEPKPDAALRDDQFEIDFVSIELD